MAFALGDGIRWYGGRLLSAFSPVGLLRANLAVLSSPLQHAVLAPASARERRRSLCVAQTARQVPTVPIGPGGRREDPAVFSRPRRLPGRGATWSAEGIRAGQLLLLKKAGSVPLQFELFIPVGSDIQRRWS